MDKINIALFFGGNSLEYNISLKSSYDIAKELEVNKNYNLLYIGILKNNIFLYNNNIDEIIIYNKDIDKIKINENNKKIYQIENGKINNIKIDIAFLGTHGGLTEDGNLQGFLKINNIKFTGCDVIGSVLCMNKSLTKLLCKSYDIKIVEYYKLSKNNYFIDKIPEIIDKLGKNLIIKINNGGSSIGIFFSNENNLLENILKAFEMCDIIIIERVIECNEYSIGIIGTYPNLLISDIGQFKKENNFFDYNTKYNSNLGNTLDIDLDEELKNNIKNYSIILYNELLIKNYARFDFFVNNNEIYFNEINTLPGLSKASLFIKLWENKNMNYGNILNLIIKNSL